MKDVADVKYEYPDLDKYVTVNGTKALMLSVTNKKGKDISKMGTQVNNKLANIERELPKDVKRKQDHRPEAGRRRFNL